MRSVAVVTLAALPALLALLALPSCEDAATPAECSDIPAGGCPLSRGVACQDPSCVAVYACRPSRVWELDHLCPPREAGAGRDASLDASAPAARPFDASVDAPPGANGGPGCAPLQAPDCSLGFALACPAGCCSCEDLYICEGGGWSYYATCNE